MGLSLAEILTLLTRMSVASKCLPNILGDSPGIGSILTQTSCPFFATSTCLWFISILVTIPMSTNCTVRTESTMNAEELKNYIKRAHFKALASDPVKISTGEFSWHHFIYPKDKVTDMLCEASCVLSQPSIIFLLLYPLMDGCCARKEQQPPSF
jgi:hypothetical protein